MNQPERCNVDATVHITLFGSQQGLDIMMSLLEVGAVDRIRLVHSGGACFPGLLITVINLMCLEISVSTEPLWDEFIGGPNVNLLRWFEPSRCCRNWVLALRQKQARFVQTGKNKALVLMYKAQRVCSTKIRGPCPREAWHVFVFGRMAQATASPHRPWRRQAISER